jgi:hypothetical protein
MKIEKRLFKFLNNELLKNLKIPSSYQAFNLFFDHS